MLLSLLSAIPQGITEGYLLGRYIRAKQPGSFALALTAGSFLLDFLCALASPMVFLISSSICYFSLRTGLILWLGKVPWRSAAAYFISYTLLRLILCVPVNLMLFPLQLAGDSPSGFYDTVIWHSAYFSLLLLAMVLPFLLCRRHFEPDIQTETAQYPPFLVVQGVMVLIVVRITHIFLGVSAASAGLSAAYLAASLMLDVVLYRTFHRFSQAQLLAQREEQNKNLLNAQRDYYRQLQDSSRALQQTRRAMAERLETLLALLEQGDQVSAMEALSEFREAVEQTGRQRYTGCNVIDAVLSAKLSTCRHASIGLTITGSVPEDIQVEALALCSATANLIDNAIHACEKLPAESQPGIQFSAVYKSPWLVFTCENPSDQPLLEKAPQLTEEHGWGLTILRGIAEQYHGDFQLRSCDGQVKAILWLLPGSSAASDVPADVRLSPS